MQPYGKSNKNLRGISGRRKSKATPHRKRCLSVDKKAARQESSLEIDYIQNDLKLENDKLKAEVDRLKRENEDLREDRIQVQNKENCARWGHDWKYSHMGAGDLSIYICKRCGQREKDW